MQTTDNYGLNLPESSDYADISKLNENFEKLDAQALSVQAAKTSPEDADRIPLVDSADSSKTKLILWSAIKTALSSVFAGITHAARHKTGGADALAPADIGAASGSVKTATLTVAGWSSLSQSVNVAGVTTMNRVDVSAAPASAVAYAKAKVLCTAQAAGTLTFTCSKVPAVDLIVNVGILNL